MLLKQKQADAHKLSMVELSAMNIQKDLSEEVFKKEDIILSGSANIKELHPEDDEEDKVDTGLKKKSSKYADTAYEDQQQQQLGEDIASKLTNVNVFEVHNLNLYFKNFDKDWLSYNLFCYFGTAIEVAAPMQANYNLQW